MDGNLRQYAQRASQASTGDGDHARWQRYRRAIVGEQLPCAIVDLDAVEANSRTLNAIAEGAGKTLRLATKSIRTPALIKRLLDDGAPTVRGLMTYTVSETAFLAEQGFDDFLLAYPTVQKQDAECLAQLSAEGRNVSIVVDGEEQLQALSAAAVAARATLRVVLEIDLSFRAASGAVHLGGRRSPLHDAQSLLKIADRARDLAGLEVYGVMGYEGQVAGSTDRSPFKRWMNPVKRGVKLISKRKIAQTRAEVGRVLKQAGHNVRVFNGGGTGSLRWSTQEAVLTEVAAGSGYLDSHLFSYYKDLDLTPAAFFALQVVRRPQPGMVTCHGGGYVASGEVGQDRLPIPALPAGAKLVGFEGTGEVQTPLILPPGVDVAPGEPFFFRHAKAGELAEHFLEYLFVRGDKVVERAKTYRGYGHCFLG